MACIFLSCHFKKKIQANDGHVLIIKELCGSLYLFLSGYKKRYKLEIDSVGKYKRDKR